MKYFKISEFDCPSKDGSGKKMDKGFLEMLDNARDIANTSFVITSGYRESAHNKKVGGSSTSSHLKGVAADVACTSGSKRLVIINSLLEAGFTRLGIASSFIHVDLDDTKPDAIWTY